MPNSGMLLTCQISHLTLAKDQTDEKKKENLMKQAKGKDSCRTGLAEH